MFYFNSHTYVKIGHRKKLVKLISLIFDYLPISNTICTQFVEIAVMAKPLSCHPCWFHGPAGI